MAEDETSALTKTGKVDLKKQEGVNAGCKAASPHAPVGLRLCLITAPSPVSGLNVFFLETKNTPKAFRECYVLLPLHSLNGEICF